MLSVTVKIAVARSESAREAAGRQEDLRQALRLSRHAALCSWPPAFLKNEKEQTLRIVSLNAWGGRLHGPLMPYLVDVDADVLWLQEVVRTKETEAAWLVDRDHAV